jgi:hypothetical protein
MVSDVASPSTVLPFKLVVPVTANVELSVVAPVAENVPSTDTPAVEVFTLSTVVVPAALSTLRADAESVVFWNVAAPVPPAKVNTVERLRRVVPVVPAAEVWKRILPPFAEPVPRPAAIPRLAPAMLVPEPPVALSVKAKGELAVTPLPINALLIWVLYID